MLIYVISALNTEKGEKIWIVLFKIILHQQACPLLWYILYESALSSQLLSYNVTKGREWVGGCISDFVLINAIYFPPLILYFFWGEINIFGNVGNISPVTFWLSCLKEQGLLSSFSKGQSWLVLNFWVWILILIVIKHKKKQITWMSVHKKNTCTVHC